MCRGGEDQRDAAGQGSIEAGDRVSAEASQESPCFWRGEARSDRVDRSHTGEPESRQADWMAGEPQKRAQNVVEQLVEPGRQRGDQVAVRLTVLRRALRPCP